MITDESVERALDYLRDQAEIAAVAKAERIYMEEYRKVVKAHLMSQPDVITESIGAQERHAYGHPTYTAHLDAMRTAIAADERHRFLMAAAEAKIEAWRTMCSNNRAQGKMV